MLEYSLPQNCKKRHPGAWFSREGDPTGDLTVAMRELWTTVANETMNTGGIPGLEIGT